MNIPTALRDEWKNGSRFVAVLMYLAIIAVVVGGTMGAITLVSAVLSAGAYVTLAVVVNVAIATAYFRRIVR